MDYILGNNPEGRSYMVGFGKKPPTQAHHRKTEKGWRGGLCLDRASHNGLKKMNLTPMNSLGLT